jgi:hypothetical protein
MCWSWCPEIKIPQFVEELSAAGCKHGLRDPRPLELNTILKELRSRPYRATFYCRGIRTEVFVPWHPFHHCVLHRSLVRDLEGRRLRIHAAEDLIVFKKIFDRPKDIGDIKAMLLAQKGKLDLPRLRTDAKSLLTEASSQELDQLINEFR